MPAEVIGKCSTRGEKGLPWATWRRNGDPEGRGDAMEHTEGFGEAFERISAFPFPRPGIGDAFERFSAFPCARPGIGDAPRTIIGDAFERSSTIPCPTIPFPRAESGRADAELGREPSRELGPEIICRGVAEPSRVEQDEGRLGRPQPRGRCCPTALAGRPIPITGEAYGESGCSFTTLRTGEAL